MPWPIDEIADIARDQNALGSMVVTQRVIDSLIEESLQERIWRGACASPCGNGRYEWPMRPPWLQLPELDAPAPEMIGTLA